MNSFPKLAPTDTLLVALQIILFGSERTAFVIDEGQKLLGVITEGDVLRAVRDGFTLHGKVSNVMHLNYFLTERELTDFELLEILAKHGILAVPVVTEDRKLINVQYTREALARKLTDLNE